MSNLIKRFISENTGIIIRIDDIAENMNWQLMEKCEELFDKYNIKPVLGVIPNNKDEELCSTQKKKIFGNLLEVGKEKVGKYQCMGIHMYIVNQLKKKITSDMEENLNFFGVELEKQILKIKNGLEKFDSEKIKKSGHFMLLITLMI